MSHFSVLVVHPSPITQDTISEKLAPFDENAGGTKWDWWMLGGRWSGMLLLKPGSEGEKGQSGLMGAQRDESGVDIARFQDVDFEAMKKRDEGDFSVFAVVTADGQWLEKGEMGWLACVSNENKNWGKDFAELLTKIKPTDYVAIVDCHI